MHFQKACEDGNNLDKNLFGESRKETRMFKDYDGHTRSEVKHIFIDKFIHLVDNCHKKKLRETHMIREVSKRS